MSQELTQEWLAEIKALRKQITELLSERDTWWKSAEKWQKLYNTEAEQRRKDAQMSQQAIASLKTEIGKLKGVDQVEPNDTTTAAAISQEISGINSIDELKAKLISVITERDRLLLLLKNEQDNHAQTRKSLTTALGDAIDSLTKQREGEQKN
ncbi:hypothetical protein G7B40_017525 [Aetokthonos hydrillicola Thurmond2011]|jgi:thiamine pyrophosphate-dependent acetolactate synthase large subunit-like protein|uniref:Uncharacterized protein n=1 Tax=Aetokthonos hydrillicola Thurmond2011 TaxID=2712845 RepID=A0AAP5MB29_9CYAN|nr:hypothetical protein [Aetokthonos hydrillicola]MBO3458163.1 hypothetical protein [Aetokthonos hydrillicola CCALA 1050]MBW4584383.1 hypothetical protein [Aetokthonos hydrillicola CCALA 1050]MDR9896344.1 hypothetical protein [Aetokthonos hydrillicola Thurmond2011]